MQFSRPLALGRDVALGLLLFVTVAAAVLYAGFGFRASVLHGQSMEPTLSDGSLVITRAGNGAAVGDVVKFNYNGIPTIHRVIGMRADGMLETKGDNASLFQEAQPVPSSAIDGRYVASLPPLGGTWKLAFERPLAVLLMTSAVLMALPMFKGIRRRPASPTLEDRVGG